MTFHQGIGELKCVLFLDFGPPPGQAGKLRQDHRPFCGTLEMVDHRGEVAVSERYRIPGQHQPLVGDPIQGAQHLS